MSGELGKEWFDAVSIDEAEADATWQSYKARRAANQSLEGMR